MSEEKLRDLKAEQVTAKIKERRAKQNEKGVPEVVESSKEKKEDKVEKPGKTNLEKSEDKVEKPGKTNLEKSEDKVEKPGKTNLEKSEDKKDSDKDSKIEKPLSSGIGKLKNQEEKKVKAPTDLSASQDSLMDKGVMKIDKDGFKILPTSTLEISTFAYSNPLKEGREDTVTGLTQTVRESGVLNPVQVIELPEQTKEEQAKLDEKGKKAPKYLLMDGLRRVFASLKVGKKEIPANIWRFKEPEKGQKMSVELGLWLNRSQPHTWKEVWNLAKVMEEKNHTSPEMIEFMFHLDGGDYMKLKDVMLSQYEGIRIDLLNEKKDLDQSYKALIKKRKDEDELENEDHKGFEDTTGEKGVLNKADFKDEGDSDTEEDEEEPEQLNNEQVKELLDMKKDTPKEEEVTDKDFNELSPEEESKNFEEMNSDKNAVVQDTKNRIHIDPAIKKTVMFRDNFRCTCCGTGGVAFLDVLIFHHIIPVHSGGADTVDNGTTLCDTCHLTLHVAERNEGRLPMSKEQFEEYSDSEKQRILNILKLGQIAYKSDKMKGYSIEKINKIARKAATHHMPGERIKENSQLFKEYKAKGNEEVKGSNKDSKKDVPTEQGVSKESSDKKVSSLDKNKISSDNNKNSLENKKKSLEHKVISSEDKNSLGKKEESSDKNNKSDNNSNVDLKESLDNKNKSDNNSNVDLKESLDNKNESLDTKEEKEVVSNKKEDLDTKDKSKDENKSDKGSKKDVDSETSQENENTKKNQKYDLFS